MAPKRPLEVVSPEQVQEGPRSPRKRLRRTVLVVMCPARICMRYRERRRASAATVEQLAQMIRQVQLDIARLFMLFRVFGGDSMSMDRLLVLLDLPNIIQRLLAEQLAALQSFFMVSIQDMVRSTLQTAMQGGQAALVPNVINDPPRHMRQGFPDTGGNTRVKLRFVDVDRPEDPLYTGYPVKWQNGENPKLTDMKKENWSTLIKHATTSDPGVEIYSYGVAEENIELLFNDFYDLVGMMIGGDYVPVNDLDQLQQHKANNWKKSAYKKFEERESSGGLTPDYFMNKNNGRPVPVREVPLNNDAGPSVQARTTWQYPNDMAAQHEFGDQRPLSVFSRAAILSNNDAGPSNQETLLFPQHTYEQILHQGLGEHGPSIPQNGTPYCLPQENILNDQGQFSAQSTIPPRNFHGASLAAQGEGTSSLGHVFADLSSGFPSDQFEDCNDLDLDITEYMKNNGIAPANNADLWNANAPFDGYGHDGGNQ
ncbi:hypothetical protein ZWY2020_017834 [Hordeum vulgare]|nr:hypothetical protein ZWY2020_017834 [Hordeum vulgare]